MIANGTTARSTNYELDGISNIDPEDNDYRTPVSVEGVREFEVLTANYNAEFGRAGGAQVRAISKSGTNISLTDRRSSISTTISGFSPRRPKCKPRRVYGRPACRTERQRPAGGCFADFSDQPVRRSPPAVPSSATACSTSRCSRTTVAAAPIRRTSRCRCRPNGPSIPVRPAATRSSNEWLVAVPDAEPRRRLTRGGSRPMCRSPTTRRISSAASTSTSARTPG